jgi:hypothetical protein
VYELNFLWVEEVYESSNYRILVEQVEQVHELNKHMNLTNVWIKQVYVQTSIWTTSMWVEEEVYESNKHISLTNILIKQVYVQTSTYMVEPVHESTSIWVEQIYELYKYISRKNIQ